MSHQNTVFHQLLKPILRQDFERLAKLHHSGQKLRSATRWDQFVAILMSQLSCRQSLRDIQSNLESQQEKLYHLGAKRIARSTLARLNEEQPASLYQQLFTQLLQRCENSKTAHKFRFKNPLYSLDASHIDLSLSLCEWAKVHESKASIKLSVGLNHSNTIPEFVALGDGIENDMVQGRAFKFPAGSIIVFDKGYVDYQWFAQLTLQNVSFVTRLRPKTVYQVKSSRSVLATKGIIADECIELSSAHAKKRGAPELLRRIEFYDTDKKRTFEFLSNNFHLAASTIAAIYKDRWKIELFFKAIKQNLKLKSFLGRSRNAIQTQIWIALIAYLLVNFAKHMAQEGWSVQRLLRIIQVNLFERKLLRSLFVPDKKWRKQEEPQLRFFL
ncbi:IS4 family transposase [Acinetobacter nosocomialis]|uniref:IS4 family transposase n=45 Tax=Gammaproteobacteria TaxID=1236 RepID=A0AB37CRU9_ACINO|nr:IS4 family transposase [Acinetobacter nosocomialis]MBR7727147.1 IS4 family transposase [Acinetobacter nosocomialis]QGA43326.1 IS4 family transposase [Acinetobacter nosocomialis]